jgi:hypothetical protein
VIIQNVLHLSKSRCNKALEGNMAKIHLSLYQNGKIELDEIEFVHPLLKTSILSVRGKSCSGHQADATFQWTSALQALTVLFLKSTALGSDYRMTGVRSSPAASLDYSISKQPMWVLEVFGRDAQGISLIRRIVRRTNSNLKRSGPLFLSLNTAALSPSDITISVNGRDVTEWEEINKLGDALSEQISSALSLEAASPVRRLAA